MSDLSKFIAEERERDAGFRHAFDEEAALHALVMARQQAGLSQQQVAAKLGVSQSHVARLERGSKSMNMSTMLRFAEAVGARVEITYPH